jgi:glycerol-3-phosphate acyltransferase PlsY
MEHLLVPTLLLLGAYLLGSLNGALLLGRLRGVDIRTQGSGNAGGTNALRTQGPLFALGVIVIDIAKAWIAVRVLGGPGTTWLAVGCGFAAVLGHVYPVFHGFRGGKGVATLLAVSPLLLAAVLGIWLVMMMLFGMVGLGSIVASAALPLLALLGVRGGWLAPEATGPLLGFGIACALLVIWTHRANLQRMRAGTEPRAKRLWLLGRLRGRT